LHTEDWSDEETAFRPQITKPFPDFTELFTLPEKIGILRRARRRWGWVGIWTAMARERKVHKLLTQERILGLDLLMGLKPVAGPTAVEAVATEAPVKIETSVDLIPEEEQLKGLPLFGAEYGDGDRDGDRDGDGVGAGDGDGDEAPR
jgi:hypothetical protein